MLRTVTNVWHGQTTVTGGRAMGFSPRQLLQDTAMRQSHNILTLSAFPGHARAAGRGILTTPPLPGQGRTAGQ
eukprot:9172055-Pyramimonas_sp.AAC.1